MNLLTARKGTHFGRFDAAVLCLYSCVVAWAIRHHLASGDEAQAWLIARDSSLHDLLLRRLHYEGAPPLWHLLLWVAARLHLPYTGINWLGAAFAIAGVYLLLRFAPFPSLFRWLLPFTFFLQYQYAVIARPYTLAPVLIFALCILYTQQRPRPILFALVAGLLVNLCFQSAVLACVFAALYFCGLLVGNRPVAGKATAQPIAPAISIFLLLSVFAAAVAFPAPDAGLAGTTRRFMAHPSALLLKLIPEEKLPPSAPPLDPPLHGRETPSHATHVPAIVRVAATAAVFGANAACFPIARSNLIAVFFLVSLSLWLWSRRNLQLGLPFLIAILASTQVVIFDHHTGIFLLALVAATWISLATRRTPLYRSRWIEPLFASVSLLVVLLQIGWSIHCVRAESSAPYDPGRETEAFLAQSFPGKRIAGFAFESVSTQAYAPHNLFFNWPESYWLWSVPVSIDRRRSEALAQHPDVVVAGDFIPRGESVANQWLTIVPAGQHPYAPMLEFWQQNGYRITHRFCGDKFMRLGVTDSFCEVILEPVSGSSVGQTP
jgi:hypothetical protein